MSAKMPATQLAVLEYAAILSAWIGLLVPPNVGARASMMSAEHVHADQREHVRDDRAGDRAADRHPVDRAAERHPDAEDREADDLGDRPDAPRAA